MFKSKTFALFAILLTSVLAATPASSQTIGAPGQPPTETTFTGVVSSSNSSTLVLRTPNNQFLLFVYDEHAIKPVSIAVGSTVSVIGTTRSDGVLVAHYIAVTAAGPAAATPGAAAPPKTAPGTPAPAPAGAVSNADEVIPENMRDLQRDIARQARKFHAGVQGGVGLDPELIILGLNAKIGPLFSRDLSFRPNVDFMFGEVTKAFAINLDVAYRLPLSPRNSAWSAYLGTGPNFSFLSRNFEKAASGDSGVDFSEFDFKAGLNVIGGVEYRSGLFYEMKAGVWTEPTLRFMIGYRF